MDLSQTKLSQEEWESLEVPVNAQELRILKLIQDGYNNANITFNDSLSLVNHIKIGNCSQEHHKFLYNEYLREPFNACIKPVCLAMPSIKKKLANTKDKTKKIKLKKADIIRIRNTDRKIKNLKSSIFEFIVLDELANFIRYSGSKKTKHFYTLTQLIKYKVPNFNIILFENVNIIIQTFIDMIDKTALIKNAQEFIEQNDIVTSYSDIKLYSHQKELFTHCKYEGPKLILYQAPTGTGKTLSPIGLINGRRKVNGQIKPRRVIFVCAAKHVGLQLAKSCISLGIKIGVAFGCQDPGNIRLHWFAAKKSVRNRRSGGIWKVDNSVGDNVEIMISDVQSYLPAMYYMKAFNEWEDLILYWDEPTITLDYEEHAYHEILSKNWKENMIPNVVLSSATLPQEDELTDMISSFMGKFGTTNIINIVSHDCSKTIPILDSTNHIVLPHFIYSDYSDLKRCVKHIKKYKTLLRHFDIKYITKFIIYVNKHTELKKRYTIDEYFDSIQDINILSIKEYYLLLLSKIGDSYTQVFEHFQRTRNPVMRSSIKLTTSDAHTLRDGPTIYLANNVNRIGSYCLKTAKIPDIMLNAILEDMEYNEMIRTQIQSLEQILDKKQNKSVNGGGETKANNKGKGNTEKKLSNDERKLLEEITMLREQIKRIRMGTRFIPNTAEHLEYWGHRDCENAFTCSIDDDIVAKIMLLDVEPNWKLLLLMGIGVFAEQSNADYVAIMKALACKQQLYLIIASSDYIYGTNYQFCHGYIGKDLANLSQEKVIQALGRVGRSNVRQNYSIRLRSDDIIHTLFQKCENKIEVRNMNRLFC